MALVTINGVAFPDPTQYKVDIEPLGTWERNANGFLVGDLVAYKAKINLTWAMLTATEFQLLLSGVKPFFFMVRYLDPRTNGYNSGEFYSSPRSGELAALGNGQTYWSGVTANLIER